MTRQATHPHDDELMTAAAAKIQVADQDRKRALKAIAEERTKLDRAKANAKRAQERFDKIIAAAVTSDQTAEIWYSKPGPLPADQVREAAKLSSVQLHRLMKRERTRATKKGGRRR